MDAQTDLSHCWAHSHFVGFVMRRLCYTVLEMLNVKSKKIGNDQGLIQSDSNQSLVNESRNFYRSKCLRDVHYSFREM